MKTAFLSSAGFAIAVLVGHISTLNAVPSLIMKTAIERMAERGVPMHDFVLSERTTPQTQTVVRPSPDLAYSICRYDLKDGEALRLQIGAYDGYSSLSVFDARTNNVASVRVGREGRVSDRAVTLLKGRLDDTPADGSVLKTPTSRGLILIRRLAPTAEKYSEVEAVAKADRCDLIAAPPP